MKQFIIILCALLPLLAAGQRDSIPSGVYSWKKPIKISTYGATTILFEGKTRTMERLQVSSNVLYPAKFKAEMHVPDQEELLIIIHSGTLKLEVKDSLHIIGAGSIALLMPGDIYSLQSIKSPCSYYTLYYRNVQSVNAEQIKATSIPAVINWDTVTFKPSEKGGRRNFLERPTAMCKRLEIHVTTLKEGLESHAPHTHKSAEFTLIKEGKTKMQIGDATYKGEACSIYYAPSNVLHALQNTGVGNCTYFAIQFE